SEKRANVDEELCKPQDELSAIALWAACVVSGVTPQQATVSASPTAIAAGPRGSGHRAHGERRRYQAQKQHSAAVEGRHPSRRKITREQAALRLLVLKNIRDRAFKLPNLRRGRPEYPLEKLQSVADYQLLWSKFEPHDVCVWCNPLSRIIPI